MTPDIATLMSDISYWEFLGYVALGAVLVGVAGESLKEFTDWPARAGIERLVTRVSVLVLIVGLAGECVTQPNTNAANARLVAIVNRQTAAIALDLEKERAKRQSRVLTQEQFDAIAGLKGRISSVSIAYASSCVECSVYAQQIMFAFREANVDVKYFIAENFIGAWNEIVVKYPDFPQDNILVNTFIGVGLLGAVSKLSPETTHIPNAPMDIPLLMIGERFPDISSDAAKILFKPPPPK